MSQGLAVPLIIKLLRYMHKQPAILNCEVEPRVGGICQVPLRPSVTCQYVSFGKPWPERTKSFVSSFNLMSPIRTYLDQADTRAPDPYDRHLFDTSLQVPAPPPVMRCSEFTSKPSCVQSMLQHSCVLGMPHLTPFHVHDGTQCDHICCSS